MCNKIFVFETVYFSNKTLFICLNIVGLILRINPSFTCHFDMSSQTIWICDNFLSSIFYVPDFSMDMSWKVCDFLALWYYIKPTERDQSSILLQPAACNIRRFDEMYYQVQRCWWNYSWLLRERKAGTLECHPCLRAIQYYNASNTSFCPRDMVSMRIG